MRERRGPAGFDGVGRRVPPAADERVWPMIGDTPMMRETLARLADTGRQVLDVELIMLRPDHRLDDVLQVLDAAVRLGGGGAEPAAGSRWGKIPTGPR